jgi:DNA-binding Lrp family transcriptional regulator
MEYRIDSTDIQIMKLLTRDCRLSYRSIALTLDITINTVKRRIKNLISRKVIEEFLVRVNLGAFGYNNIYNLILKYRGNIEKKVIGYLQNRGYVFMHSDCVGGVSRFALASKDNLNEELRSLPVKIESVQVIDIFSSSWESNFFFNTNDLKILKCLIAKPRTKVKEIAKAIHVSQKTVSRRIDAMVSNHVLDFTIIVNPREMKGYVNVGIFIHVEKQRRNEVTKKIYEEIKNLLALGPPYEDIDTIGFNLYVQNMWEIENIQRKVESFSGFKNVSTILPLRRQYYHNLLLEEIDRRISTQTLPRIVSKA